MLNKLEYKTYQIVELICLKKNLQNGIVYYRLKTLIKSVVNFHKDKIANIIVNAIFGGQDEEYLHYLFLSKRILGENTTNIEKRKFCHIEAYCFWV